jgi:hypothetical protein
MRGGDPRRSRTTRVCQRHGWVVWLVRPSGVSGMWEEVVPGGGLWYVGCGRWDGEWSMGRHYSTPSRSGFGALEPELTHRREPSEEHPGSCRIPANSTHHHPGCRVGGLEHGFCVGWLPTADPWLRALPSARVNRTATSRTADELADRREEQRIFSMPAQRPHEQDSRAAILAALNFHAGVDGGWGLT